jgi:putative NADH-flavin reductase
VKVALYGATGKSGSRILKELISRGHQVIAITRDPSKVPQSEVGVSIRQDDLSDPKKIAAAVDGADAVVSAYAPPQDDPDAIVGVTQRQVEALKRRAKTRLIVVGGAGGLHVAPGVTLVDSGYLPEAVLPIAKAHVNALTVLKASDTDWTYLAPAAFFEPGQRTGTFRLGRDELIANAQQESRISMEDYAIALVDELEKPRHRRQRFSVGY